MFTGIVQGMGTIQALDRRDFGARLVVGRGDWRTGPIPAGDSVAVSGVCLTVVACDEGTIAFDVVPQTLAATTLGEKQPGDRVNLEPSLVVGQSLGGHFVQGHVDGVATVARVERGDGGHRVTFEAPADLTPYLVPRGSVTLDGVSMTLAEVAGRHFTVAVIPTTLAVTTLGLLDEGARVNVETDILARTIVQRLHAQATSEDRVDVALLRAAGFID